MHWPLQSSRDLLGTVPAQDELTHKCVCLIQWELQYNRWLLGRARNWKFTGESWRSKVGFTWFKRNKAISWIGNEFEHPDWICRNLNVIVFTHKKNKVNFLIFDPPPPRPFKIFIQASTNFISALRIPLF